MALRRLSPGGYEYLTDSVACADRDLEAGESLSDYYLTHGYPPGEWFGAGATALGVSGEVPAAQMNALFGEGRHPDADRIEAAMIAAGASPEEALRATKLGRRFAQYGGADELRSKVGEAYKQYNRDHGRPVGAPLNEQIRATIRLRVQTETFAAAHNGREPTDDNELTHWLADQKRQLKSAVAGYEVVFAPPKSVSVAWALSDHDTRELITSLHRQAVKDTLTHLENNAAFTRQGNWGEAQVDIQGITAAIFEHWDSRTGDPHLHTHVPISAKVKRINDGKWTTLDTRTIHASAVVMSEFYNSRLRDLFRDHGADWTERPAESGDLKRPVWELTGVSDELLIGFSQRSRQVETDRAQRIVAFRAEHGREASPKELLEIGRRAQYATRDAKQAPRTLADHLRRWRQFASGLVDAEQLHTLGSRVFGGAGEPLSAVDIDVLAGHVRFVVCDHYSHWTRWHVEAEAHRQTAHLRVATDAREAVVGSIADAVINAPDTIALRVPVLIAEPGVLRRRDGESVFVEHNSQRYTTEQTLREEAALVAWARRGGGHRLTTDTIARALVGVSLNAGQRRMVTEFARSGRRVQLALAPAGAGKTTAMKAFAQAWRSAGGRVYAFGPSARAAQELGASIDATPHTLHQVTTALKFDLAEHQFDFRAGDVLVIDEAAMSGTHTLHEVVRYALRRGADVRLVGDDKQLGAVEAGGAIRLIAHDVGAVRFQEVVRFTDLGQAAASLQIRAGSPAGLGYYLDNNWVASGSRETMRDAAQRGWRADLDAGRQTLLIVPTNDDVVSLNVQARAQRLQRGDIDTAQVVNLHDGTGASVGDWIVTRHNNRQLSVFAGQDFVKNGDTWHVTAIEADGALQVRHRSHRGTAILPPEYVDAHVELAYATTVNRVQGMTSDHTAHTVVPKNMTREQFYPAITRARGENRMYVETTHHVADDHRETPPEQTAEAVLCGVLAHTGAETAATEELRAALGAEESLATLVARHDYGARLGDEDRYLDVLAQHAPEVIDQPAEPALVQTLRNATDLDWQAEQLVPTAVAQGSLTDAEDPAAVLQWRIEQHVEAHQPPARVAEPRLADINRWRSIIEESAPAAAVEDQQWEFVWRYAAAGVDEGLDADTAVRRAAEQLATRAAQDPRDDYRYTAQTVVTELATQRQAGSGQYAALPWLARPDYTAVRDDPELAQYLTDMNAAIADRVGELREQVTREQPAWIAGLGPRIAQPAAAARWDELAGLAAAYRETYNITGSDPTAPLGPQPDTAGAKAHAWKYITDQWRPPVTTQDDLRSRNQQRIDALRDQVVGRREDYREDTADELAYDRAESAEDYRRHDDEQLEQDTDFHSDLGY
ncbi:MAG: MobF family relaxase [Pseudonocardiaceae bacterium]